MAFAIYFCAYDVETMKAPAKNEALIVWGIVASIIPFWFRFWQCIHKYVMEENKPQLANAGKYFSKMIPPVLAIWYAKKVYGQGFWIYFVFNLIATLYCLVWDYYMDWGLFRSWESGSYMLRPRGNVLLARLLLWSHGLQCPLPLLLACRHLLLRL